MYINAAIVDDLHDRQGSFDSAGEKLPYLVQLLERAASLTVTSLLGWRLRLVVESAPLLLTSVHHGTVQASLRVPLGAVSPVWADGFLPLFAAQPDAFAVLATDVATALHLPFRRFRLDEDLEQNQTSGVTGLGEISAVNQAIGVLIDRGHRTFAVWLTSPVR
jgi:hypothetical protein